MKLKIKEIKESKILTKHQKYPNQKKEDFVPTAIFINFH